MKTSNGDRLTPLQRRLTATVAAGAGAIAAIGFIGSYAAVARLATARGFGTFAIIFPIGIDAGIIVLLALDLMLTWIRIPFPLLRQTAWMLTAATIAFNGAAAWPDPLGVGMHAVIPVLFVVVVEAARHAIGRIADITADKHMESVRLTRWLLSPLPTFLLWRRMKLWELRSYDEVIRLEQARRIEQARLRARYGRKWRSKAPVSAVMALRLTRYGRELAPVSGVLEIEHGATQSSVSREPLPEPVPDHPSSREPEPAHGPDAEPTAAAAVSPDFEETVDTALSIAANTTTAPDSETARDQVDPDPDAAAHVPAEPDSLDEPPAAGPVPTPPAAPRPGPEPGMSPAHPQPSAPARPSVMPIPVSVSPFLKGGPLPGGGGLTATHGQALNAAPAPKPRRELTTCPAVPARPVPSVSHQPEPALSREPSPGPDAEPDPIAEPPAEPEPEPDRGLLGGSAEEQITDLTARLKDGERLTKTTAAVLLGVSPATAGRRLAAARARLRADETEGTGLYL